MKKLTREKTEKKTESVKSDKAVTTKRRRDPAQCCAKISSTIVGCHD